jgi:hypothetical protein
MRNVDNIFVGKPEGKRELGRPRHRWEDNIRTDLREIGWEGMDSIHLAQHRVKIISAPLSGVTLLNAVFFTFSSI